MTSSKMNPGDVVTIYEDPISQTREEGRARLVALLRSAVRGRSNLEQWKVQFLGDPGEPHVVRAILPPGAGS